MHLFTFGSNHVLMYFIRIEVMFSFNIFWWAAQSSLPDLSSSRCWNIKNEHKLACCIDLINNLLTEMFN